MGNAKHGSPGYKPVAQAEPEEIGDESGDGPLTLPNQTPARRRRWTIFGSAVALAAFFCLGLGLATGLLVGTRIAAGSGSGSAAAGAGAPCAPPNSIPGGSDPFPDPDLECPCRPPTSTVPQYFQTSPELWAGPTATGRAPFMAQTRVFEGTYVPNAPLQTAVPVVGAGDGGEESIFEMMGYLAPYVPSPGFGVDEYPLPPGAEIIQVQMLSRHGSRYPTTGSNVVKFGERIAEAGKKGKLRFRDSLEFLGEWKYELGMETLVHKGRQELFESGVLHAYMYSQLYNPNSKIIVRTTSQDRILKSAEYFMAGFFGLEWTRNATIEVIIEEKNFNNSLAGEQNCPNAHRVHGGWDAANNWVAKYLQNATDRFRSMADGYQWTLEDTYAAQTMCPYETVAYGYSRFCELFTYGEAVGIGYQQEVIARLENHTLGYSGSQINVTLDNNTVTFPLNQSLYLDFSHDTNIISVLTAFGLTQFAEPLDPSAYPGSHHFTVSHLTPFAARLDIEIIRTPKPLAANRSAYLDGGETKYVHFVLNQRTIHLGWSIPDCDASRVDGWCEFEAFLRAQERMLGLAKFQQACFGDLKIGPYGSYTDGAPP